MIDYNIVWKTNNTGGKSAFVGEIRVAVYHWNAIDSRNGKYILSSMLPQSKLSRYKTDDIELIERLVIQDVKEFFDKLFYK